MMDMGDFQQLLQRDLLEMRVAQARRHKRDARVRAWAVVVITALFLLLGVWDLMFSSLSHEAPQPVEQPDTLAGCPRVGSSLGHDGRWAVCYACDGETPVCVVTGVPR